MIRTIKKYRQTTAKDFTCSVLIPTWNNLPFIQLCVKSIRSNSTYKIQIVVIANEATDGTLEWLLLQKDIDFVHAKENIGICYALNTARSLVSSEYIIYMNDDMYALPEWDSILMEEVQRIGHNSFVLSATMIEPHETGNSCVVVKDFGQDLESFDEEKLLNTYQQLKRDDWNGSTWPPNIVHIDLWDLVGGLSIEFSPGMYSDPDFSKKLYEAGVRIYKGLGKSMVYHFGSKSTRRIKRNKGRSTFLLKWGMTSNYFTKHFLFIGTHAQNVLSSPTATKTSFLNKVKRTISIWR